MLFKIASESRIPTSGRNQKISPEVFQTEIYNDAIEIATENTTGLETSNEVVDVMDQKHGVNDLERTETTDTKWYQNCYSISQKSVLRNRFPMLTNC